MFYRPKNLIHTPLKRTVYLVAATILGFLLSLIAHAIIEKIYLDWLVNNHKVITWYKVFGLGSCALHPAIQIILLLVGAIGGFFLGRLWYRLLYIDKIWIKK